MPARPTFDYAVVRIVPRVEREEFINAGVILFSREHNFLGMAIDLDEVKMQALDSSVDVDLIRDHLQALQAVANGDNSGGPLAGLTPAERFHWLTSPRSTVLQVSAVHTGWCDDPERALDDLMNELVRGRRDRSSDD